MRKRSKLAVLLHADIVDSTALVRRDEQVAHELIQGVFHRLSEFVVRYGGVAHEIRGDAVVAEFSTSSEAVTAALGFQASNRSGEREDASDSHPAVRIGIALGEVVIADNTVTGTGVVLAQRIEQLASPGSVCISAAIHEALPGRLPFAFDNRGDQTLKGFQESVRVYSVDLAPGSRLPEPSSNIDLADDPGARHAGLPDKPAIAVLPFENLSSDPEQGYFADGMTEDIITGLSRFRSLVVTARNSTFAYKRTPSDARQVARELVARYVLEGSVRTAGKRVRVSAQLIDALTGNHLWAERYDRDLEDLFVVQDEVTDSIVAAIAPEIGHEERKRAQRKPPESLEAWDVYQRGLLAFHSSTTREAFISAIDQFDRVNEIDPTFAPGFAMAAGARTRYVAHYSPDDRVDLLTQAREKASKAIALDPRDPFCLWNDGRVQSLLGNHEVAIARVEDAVALNPGDAMSHHYLGVVLCTAGRSKRAIPHFDRAMRLSPRDIFIPGMQTYRAFALFDLGRYDEALDWVQRARLSPHPRPLTFALLVAALTRLGRKEEAREALNDLLLLAPGACCSRYRANQFGGAEAMGRFANALREAGLAE